MSEKHRSGHRYHGILTFRFDDGTTEQTKIEVKDVKGAFDRFMVDCLQAVVEMIVNFKSKTETMRVSYNGDFSKDVALLVSKMSDKSKLAEIATLIKRYEEASAACGA